MHWLWMSHYLGWEHRRPGLCGNADVLVGSLEPVPTGTSAFPHSRGRLCHMLPRCAIIVLGKAQEIFVAQMNSRIDQFRKMANDDPTNEVAHFSLGRELLSAGQYEPAIASFQRCLELNPNISKAYQLEAQALLQLNRRDEAIAKLTEGVRRADERGDMMPRNDMARMLKDLGAAVPEFKSASQPQREVGAGEVQC